jgi:hypothetical protein
VNEGNPGAGQRSAPPGATSSFRGNLHLDTGGKRIELSHRGNIHQEGNI